MDGEVKSIGDLKIVIDASTEKFSGNIQGARDLIKQFAGDAEGSLGKFDGILLKTGQSIESVRNNIDAFVMRVNPLIGTLMASYDKFMMLGNKMGLGEDVQQIDNAFRELFYTVGLAGPEALNAVAMSAEDAKDKLNLISQAGDGAIAGIKGSGVRVVSGVADTIRVLSTSIQLLLGRVAEMTNDQLIAAMRALQSQIKEAEETGTVSFQNMEAFGTSFGEVIKVDAKNVEELKNKLKVLNDELERRANDQTPADMTKYIEGLQRANEELKLRTDMLGKEKSEAEEYYALERAKLEAKRQGRKISEEDQETIEAEAAAKRELIELEEAHAQKLKDIAEAKRRAAEFERYVAGQERAIDNINAAMETEISQIERKIAAMQRGQDVSAAEIFIQKQLQAARRANIDLSDEDIAGIEAAGAAYARLSQIAKDTQLQIALVREANQAVAQGIANEFTQWTRGAEIDVKRMTSSILADLARITLQRNVLGPLFGGYGSEGNGLFGNFFSSVFGGMRATGGPVEAGRSYLVGENGPEVVRMGADAQVTPLGGGTTFAPVINVDARGATVDAVAALEARLPNVVLDLMHQARDRGLA